ncbi:MAG: hypothetical protein WCA46_29300 [Actinocatenispora sp.]
MKRRMRVLLGLLASLVVTTGFLVGTAGSAQAVGGTVPVTAYQNVNVRTGPWTSDGILFTFHAGETRLAQCWDTGQTITDNGITSDVWIKLDAGVPEWVSAIYLKGDAHANVPWLCNH